MALSTAVFSVARAGTTVYVRAAGLANMKNAPTLHGFLEAELAQGMRRVCLDLNGCLGMDSTFMGLMVEFSKRLTDQDGRLVIVNPGPKNLLLLTMLGVNEVVPVMETCQAPVVDFFDLSSKPQLSVRERMQLIRTAHENLVQLSASNQQKFAGFLEALDRDLAKLDQGKI